MVSKPTFVEQMQAIQQIAGKSKVQARAMFDDELAAKVEEAKKLAVPIIEKIERLAQLAAADKKDGVEVMRLKPGNEDGFSDIIKKNYSKPVYGPEDLGVTAREVFDYCNITLKANPEVKACLTHHDERGMEYFIIYINWKRATTR